MRVLLPGPAASRQGRGRGGGGGAAGSARGGGAGRGAPGLAVPGTLVCAAGVRGGEGLPGAGRAAWLPSG